MSMWTACCHTWFPYYVYVLVVVGVVVLLVVCGCWHMWHGTVGGGAGVYVCHVVVLVYLVVCGVYVCRYMVTSPATPAT